MEIGKYNLTILHIERFILKRICIAVHNQNVCTLLSIAGGIMITYLHYYPPSHIKNSSDAHYVWLQFHMLLLFHQELSHLPFRCDLS